MSIITDFKESEGHASMAKELRELVEDILARRPDEPNGFILISVDREQVDSDALEYTVLSNLPPEAREGLLDAVVESSAEAAKLETSDVPDSLASLLDEILGGRGDEPYRGRVHTHERDAMPYGRLDPSKLDESHAFKMSPGMALALLLMLSSTRR